MRIAILNLMPQNYYLDDNPQKPPVDTWHEATLRFYRNWTKFLESEPTVAD